MKKPQYFACFQKGRERAAVNWALPWSEAVCKPGSVLNDHLSSPAVANRIKPPPENSRAGHMFSHGVAPDRVYSINMSPCDEWALTSLFHPYHVKWRYISVAFVRGLPLAGVTRYPCPMEPGLSSRRAFRLLPAVVRPSRNGDFTKCVLQSQ